jgi:hypothetical protein
MKAGEKAMCQRGSKQMKASAAKYIIAMVIHITAQLACRITLCKYYNYKVGIFIALPLRRTAKISFAGIFSRGSGWLSA